MLDDFAVSQPLAYKILKNTIKKNRCSHAYIIETNGTDDALKFSISFSKYLFCPYNYTNRENCAECTQCHQIDTDNFLELKVIEPDGVWIKKHQMKELEEEFKNKSLLGNKKIYIINHADQMNITAANTILKFLEEPANNIIALLIVDNIYNLLPTIISRCQIISLRKNNLGNNYSENISQEELAEKIDKCIKFIDYFERYRMDALCMTNSLWLKYFKEKENLLLGLDIMLNFYKRILDYQLNIENTDFEPYQEIADKIAKKSKTANICDKINVISKAREKIKCNANAALLMDKLIIDLGRIE